MVNIRPLSAGLQQIAEVELNEKPEEIETELAALREWLAKSPYLKARTDDQTLVTFLRSCKHSLEATKKKLDSFYTVRQALPEVFANHVINEKFIEQLKLGVNVPLPKIDGSDEPRIVIHRPGIWDSELVCLEEIMNGFTMLLDILVNEDDNFIVSGCHYIFDYRHAKLSDVPSLTMAKKLLTASQNSSVSRIKGLHFLNVPSYIVSTVNFVKSFTSEKIRKRVSIVLNSIFY